MTTNEERREAAKRKLEERLESEQRAARKRKLTIIGVSTAIVVAIAGTTTGLVLKKVADDREAARWTACEYGPQEDALVIQETEPPAQEVPEDQAEAYREYQEQYRKSMTERNAQVEEFIPLKRTAEQPADRQLKVGFQDAVFTTNLGDIPFTLDRASAPCNAGAVVSLISEGFYNDTSCHRLTATEGLRVLQCGDPTGSGAGGPGWTSPDEPPTDLEPAGEPNPMTGASAVTYPRGTIAIANQGAQAPNTGSSQFFLVIEDSQLPADYSVVGTVDEAGLTLLDKVAEGGITPAEGGSPEDGKPTTEVRIETAELVGENRE